MSVEYRLLTTDDFEQAAHVESRAFYGRDGAERVEILRQFYPPDWTVGAFVDGNLVADVRAIPQVRRMGGSKALFGAVGPVACLAPYRRQGHVGKLLKMALEVMHERGQSLSGLYTPHDALYRRYGWERAEGKKKYQVEPKKAHLRFKGRPGVTSPGSRDDWQRLAALYRKAMEAANGPFARAEVYWREVVLREYGNAGKPVDSDIVVWSDGAGQDQGYVVYFERPTGQYQGNWEQRELFVRDFIALNGDAYLGLWRHLLTHDLAARIVWETRLDDRLPDMLEDPFVVEQSINEGPMIRVVDIERAIAQRPYADGAAASAIVAIADSTLPQNDGTWVVEGGGREMRAERTDAEPEATISINMLAPLYTGYTTVRSAAGYGMIEVRDEDALRRLSRLFAVDDIPYCRDWY